MTTAGQSADSRAPVPAPAPGGTARLAGRVVARIGFGAMQLEGGNADRDTALAVLRQAVGGGVNHIDTAQFYGDCNALIRAALAPYPDDLALVSKVGAERDAGGGLVPAQRPEQLRAQVEANLATLGAERLDVVNLRRLDAAPGIVASGDQLVDIDDQLAELAALRDAGKIGGIGLSSVSAGQLDQAAPAGIACVQNLYSVIDRTAEPVLDRCRDLGVAWVPFFPLGSAFANRARVTDDPTVIAIAAEIGVTPAQVGLAWLLSSYDRTLLIPGTSDPAHLAENIAAGAVRLPPASIKALDRLAASTESAGSGPVSTTSGSARQTIERFLEAAVGPAPGDMADCYAERFVIEMPFAGGLAPERSELTREEFRARVTAGLAARRYTRALDVRIHETADPEVVVAEYRLEGRKVADASPFSLAFVMVVTVRDGLIVHSRDYSNPIDGARLLGRLPQLVAMLSDAG